MTHPLAPYDAVVVVSFGGPEQADDVLPFLRRVTAGRGIPDERLAVVGQHYYTLGGRSPVNDQGRALRAAVEERLAATGAALPVYFGNRNWAPELVDALRDAHDHGARRVLAVLTSAYASYSGCRQYRENLADAVAALADEGRELVVDKVRPYWNHPAFADRMRTHLLDTLATLTPDAGPVAVVHVTHSIPTPMAQTSGADGERGAYVRDHAALAEHLTAAARAAGHDVEHALVYCSRSGRPGDPWLEPDVNDHLRDLAARGVRTAVVVPLGFVSDHMEVVWDLDHEARATGEEAGVDVVRVPTVGADEVFVAGLVDLLGERAREARGEPVEPAAVVGTARPSVCAPGCCPNLRGPRPAACGRDAQPGDPLADPLTGPAGEQPGAAAATMRS